MDIMSIALDRIKWEIPPEILQLAFAPRRYDPSRQQFNRDNQLGVSTDAMIRRAVIDARVMIDVNLCSGVEDVISLNGLVSQRIDPWNTIYHIPKDRTGGRTINAVYSVSFGQGNAMGSYQPGTTNSSASLDAAAGVLQTNMPWTQVQSAYADLIGENVVLLSNIGQIPGLLYLRCQLSHEPNMGNLKPENYDVFTDLCELATKGYVYTNTVIPLDEGAIRAGSSIGRIREVIDGYSEANQMYKDKKRDDWIVVAHLNDREKSKRTNRYLVGGRR